MSPSGNGACQMTSVIPRKSELAKSSGAKRLAGLRPEASNEFDASLSAEMSLSERRAAAAEAQRQRR